MLISSVPYKFDKEKIAALRQTLGLSQQQFGRGIGMQRQHVSLWELGISLPSIPTLLRICDKYNVNPEFFLVETVQHNVNKKTRKHADEGCKV